LKEARQEKYTNNYKNVNVCRYFKMLFDTMYKKNIMLNENKICYYYKIKYYVYYFLFVQFL